ncbi:MAG TPA: SigB/SigF/SigG family RNA polymerase sigma factor [Sporichthyaceae bacterium]|jgi:RNA polymerase sigma-B factor|nr:SigB/SigF/SigG family RNA polymerase sigma factor [Sporichthyaceae bacterium]
MSDTELFQTMRAVGQVERDRVRDVLVHRHTGLVRWLASQYAHPGVEIDELRQVGFLGLVLAVDRFDVDRGHDFLTFARPTVQGEIRRWFRDKRRWIRLPRRLQEAKAALRESTEVLTHRLGREPSNAELAEHSGLTEKLVAEARAADDTFTTASLDAPLGSADGEESFTVADTLGTDDERIGLLLECETLRGLIHDLPERERRILHMRFYQEQTQAQIGSELGISQMHVSRLLARTLDRLRTGIVEDVPAAA